MGGACGALRVSEERVRELERQVRVLTQQVRDLAVITDDRLEATDVLRVHTYVSRLNMNRLKRIVETHMLSCYPGFKASFSLITMEEMLDNYVTFLVQLLEQNRADRIRAVTAVYLMHSNMGLERDALIAFNEGFLRFMSQEPHGREHDLLTEQAVEVHRILDRRDTSRTSEIDEELKARELDDAMAALHSKGSESAGSKRIPDIRGRKNIPPLYETPRRKHPGNERLSHQYPTPGSAAHPLAPDPSDDEKKERKDHIGVGVGGHHVIEDVISEEQDEKADPPPNVDTNSKEKEKKEREQEQNAQSSLPPAKFIHLDPKDGVVTGDVIGVAVT